MRPSGIGTRLRPKQLGEDEEENEEATAVDGVADEADPLEDGEHDVDEVNGEEAGQQTSQSTTAKDEL